jgi:hypothetical protein
MYKIATSAGAVLALFLVTAPVALADDDLNCDEAKRLVTTAQTRVDNRAAEERVEETALLREAREALRVARDLPQSTPEERETRRQAIESAQALVESRERDLDEDSRRLAELRTLLTVAIQDKDKACDDDGDDDGDGDDGDDDGDDDDDPTATPSPSTTVVLPDVNVTVPRGGVATGGGPA